MRVSEAALGVSLYAAARPPTNFQAVADAIITFYDAIKRPAKEVVALLRDGKIIRRAFKNGSFVTRVADSNTWLLHTGDVTDDDGVVVECWLRPRDADHVRYESPWITITGRHIAFDDPPVRDLVSAFVNLYDIAQGSITNYRSLKYARKECSFSGAVSSSELDLETAARLGEDQMLEGRYDRRLRRLYPITVIGPQIWEELPRLPEANPTLVVEELGPCKLIRAWPELLEPRDPTFLAGTLELRRWLWPYTIQNPADDPTS